MADQIQLIPIPGIPEIHPGDDLALAITCAANSTSLQLRDDDVLIVAQKIVSKSEGRLVNLCEVTPSDHAIEIAIRQGRDPRLIQIILSESSSLIRHDQHVLITETHHGFICANAGVDRSNVIGADWVALLPVDPDHSARQLRRRLHELAGVQPAIIITDTFGRAWREGLTNVAIGLAGIEPLLDLRGQRDDHGKDLSATILAIADEMAAASGLLMRKTARLPVILLRGYDYQAGMATAKRLIRPRERDLFR